MIHRSHRSHRSGWIWQSVWTSDRWSPWFKTLQSLFRWTCSCGRALCQIFGKIGSVAVACGLYFAALRLVIMWYVEYSQRWQTLKPKGKVHAYSLHLPSTHHPCIVCSISSCIHSSLSYIISHPKNSITSLGTCPWCYSNTWSSARTISSNILQRVRTVFVNCFWCYVDSHLSLSPSPPFFFFTRIGGQLDKYINYVKVEKTRVLLICIDDILLQLICCSSWFCTDAFWVFIHSLSWLNCSTNHISQTSPYPSFSN